MSDNIPFEIQIEIVKRVPDVRSLIRFRAVSKPWKTLIDSSEFITGYRARKTHPNTLIVSYIDNVGGELKHLSVHNDTLTQQQDLAPNVSVLMKQFHNTTVIGYSRGLLCLYAFDKEETLILWNPSLRRSVGIRGVHFFDVFGFAVCSDTNEPTIVKISKLWKLEVFTWSSKRWTEIQCGKPRESIKLYKQSQVVIGSCIYRVAYERIGLPDGYFRYQSMIVSFDLIAKELKAIDLPDKITNTSLIRVRSILSKLKGSLVVIVPVPDIEVKVWKMEPDCSFTHLFTINTPPDSYISNIVGFRKNGELVVETEEGRGSWVSSLKAYDPCSHHINNLGFSGLSASFFISSYKETLHLLDYLDSSVY